MPNLMQPRLDPCSWLPSSPTCRILFVSLSIGVGVFVQPVDAQSPQSSPAPPQHQHPAPTPAKGQPVDQMAHGDHDAASMTREGSGTAWLPDASPMYAIHARRGPWETMAHGNVFVQYLNDGGDRGVSQLGSINWVMGMAHRDIGTGRLSVRGMVSLEPATIRGCGYPDLLATGELCGGEPIHDRQHQHDLFMELAATYDRSLAGTVRWQLYGGAAGEPALGPVAYPHRVSAMPNLLAPITHHWLDSSHITFGVLTTGVYGRRWKAEASAFNGREPDEQRTGIDWAPLDSASGRVWWLPTTRLAIQASAGHLTEAEPGDDATEPRIDVTRLTASGTYHRPIGEAGIWASTAAWGRNTESGRSTHAFLLETNLTLDDRDVWYGRSEIAAKTAHDLDVPRSLVHDVEGAATFIVSKLQVGYTRYLGPWNGLKPGIGVSASAGIVPVALEPSYGGRINAGFGVFVTVRPAAMRAPAMPGPTAAGEPAAQTHETKTRTAPARVAPGDPMLPVVPAERVIDPVCAKSIDLASAPRATYQGKVYYFCSSADRDAFVEDPAGYLKKRGRQ